MQKVLHPPDGRRRFRRGYRPRWELLGDGADCGPFPLASENGEVGCGGAESSELGGGEEGGDDVVAEGGEG